MNYTKAIALARMEALDALVGALQRVKDNPAETRRIALAIFSAPEPDEAIDEALDEPPPPIRPTQSSATSPERSEGSGCSAPANACHPAHSSAPRQPATPPARTPNPSLRSGLVESVHLNHNSPAQLVSSGPTPAARLLAHSGRAP